METIKIKVENKIAYSPDAKIVCGNSDYKIEFSFDAEWGKETVKTVRFIHNNAYEDIVMTGNIIDVPIIKNTTKLSVGVFAGELRTTTPALIACVPSILCGFDTPDEPSEDVYNQIIALCNEAVNTANNVEERANNGEFDGEKGEKGEDGHTPYIKDGNWWIGENDTGVRATTVAEINNGILYLK